MKPELKKLLILNAPYLLFVYLFDKIGQAVRLSPGADLSGKVLSLADGFSAAFANPLPMRRSAPCRWAHFAFYRRFFKEIFAFVRRLKKSSVLSREKGRYYRLSAERR